MPFQKWHNWALNTLGDHSCSSKCEVYHQVTFILNQRIQSTELKIKTSVCKSIVYEAPVFQFFLFRVLLLVQQQILCSSNHQVLHLQSITGRISKVPCTMILNFECIQKYGNMVNIKYQLVVLPWAKKKLKLLKTDQKQRRYWIFLSFYCTPY